MLEHVDISPVLTASAHQNRVSQGFHGAESILDLVMYSQKK